ncbi:MAG: anhydro-N-acetylmuramic acid kinase, partial [Proteobacteria bacterium]|nr:anhydro-N-acetylmuramic acid kinase [Pseudomonadota bacterium]
MTSLSRFQRTLSSPTRTIIGLMSGMSMDGIDLALAKCSGDYPDYKIELLKSDYRPYPADLKARIKQSRHADVSEVAKLNILVANEFAACVNDFLAKNKISTDQIDAIGS